MNIAQKYSDFKPYFIHRTVPFEDKWTIETHHIKNQWEDVYFRGFNYDTIREIRSVIGFLVYDDLGVLCHILGISYDFISEGNLRFIAFNSEREADIFCRYIADKTKGRILR